MHDAEIRANQIQTTLICISQIKCYNAAAFVAFGVSFRTWGGNRGPYVPSRKRLLHAKLWANAKALTSCSYSAWRRMRPERLRPSWPTLPSRTRLASVLWKPSGATRFCSRQTWGRQVAYQSPIQRCDKSRSRWKGSDQVATDTGPRSRGMGSAAEAEMDALGYNRYEARYD